MTKSYPIDFHVFAIFLFAGVVWLTGELWLFELVLRSFALGLVAGLAVIGTYYLAAARARRQWRWYDWVNNVSLVALLATPLIGRLLGSL